MANTIARAIGRDQSGRRKEVTRLGGASSEAQANTWQTFTTAAVNADGRAWAEIAREDATQGREQLGELYALAENGLDPMNTLQLTLFGVVFQVTRDKHGRVVIDGGKDHGAFAFTSSYPARR